MRQITFILMTILLFSCSKPNKEESVKITASVGYYAQDPFQWGIEIKTSRSIPVGYSIQMRWQVWHLVRKGQINGTHGQIQMIDKLFLIDTPKCVVRIPAFNITTIAISGVRVPNIPIGEIFVKGVKIDTTYCAFRRYTFAY